MSWLEQTRDRAAKMKRDSPVIKKRWFVSLSWEQTVWLDNGHGQGRHEKESHSKVVSPYFDNKSDAEKWLDEYGWLFEGSPGLAIRMQNLRRFTEERWVSW